MQQEGVCLPVPGRHAVPIGTQHDGFVRFGCPAMTPVFAAIDGRIVVAESGGSELVIRANGDSRRVHYRRLSVGSLLVSIGDAVHSGQPIAFVGEAGESRSISGLICGLESAEGSWLDCGAFLVDALDPIMLPGSSLPARTSSVRRSARPSAENQRREVATVAAPEEPAFGDRVTEAEPKRPQESEEHARRLITNRPRPST